MNAKPDKNPGPKLKRKLGISETLSPISERNSPEINVTDPPSLTTKRKLQDFKLNYLMTLKGKDITNASLGPALKKMQQHKVSEQDVFCFTPQLGPVKGDKKSEVKQHVLRTITRMVQENRAIRQRSLTLNQGAKKL